MNNQSCYRVYFVHLILSNIITVWIIIVHIFIGQMKIIFIWCDI